MYSSASVRKGPHCSTFPSLNGALNPFASGCLELRMSNSLSKIHMNLTVPSDAR